MHVAVPIISQLKVGFSFPQSIVKWQAAFLQFREFWDISKIYHVAKGALAGFFCQDNFQGQLISY